MISMSKSNPLSFASVLLISLMLLFSGCYSFRDVSIPPEVKTVRIQYFENKARLFNPVLSPLLTDKLRQKVISQTRLTQVQGEDADYDIAGTITDCSVSTTGISNQQAASNRLNITVQIEFKNRLDESKNFEASVTRNFDFSASLTLDQAQLQLQDEIIRNLSDEIFNRIFSNW
ncbi:LPS assembly lipoprotein LptE [Flavihumibacter sp. RY-1]|uniref:LPS assembly lipoprotein LptE n=1 Tax=Flavihumibacter fluminis TaxID=2909236 RepID=A0ABS9BGX8_9BACT|nr:LptE family protein [Flavihumibacter fluminis]MCF1714845.1 LPS assembly lipoprotein LptE [Flavihumibacter fluminis]